MSVPNPAVVDWVPMGNTAPAASIPQPVVNGQWIKGVGGVPVWAPIVDADLPTRLGTVSKTISDWNAALENGWYMGNPVANGPPGTSANWVLGRVQAHNTIYTEQEVWDFTSPGSPHWRRQQINGAWQAWNQESRIIATQRQWGQEEAYFQFTTAQQMWCSSAATNPLRISFTPAVNCFWEVTLQAGIVGKVDAAYHYGYIQLLLTPADADGVNMQQHLVTQHSQVNQYEGRRASRIFRLNAGTAYRADGMTSPSGGTWTYYMGQQHLSIEGIAYAR